MPPNHLDPFLLSPTTARNVDQVSQVLGKRKLSDPTDSLGGDESRQYSADSVESSLYQLERYTSQSLNSEHSSRWYSSMLRQDPHQYLVPRLNRMHWKKLSNPAKQIIGVCLQDILNRQCNCWKFVGLTCDLPVFKCSNLPWQFTLILGGRFRVGMSPDLQDQFHRCLVDHFRVSALDELPMHSYQVQQALQLSQKASNFISRFCEITPFLLMNVPIQYEQAKSLLSSNVSDMGLHRLFRLPSEIEWEYAARGGGWDILFPYDCHIAVSRQDDFCPRNAMGLRQVGTYPELCTSTCSRGDDFGPASNLVVRGGSEMWSLIYHSRPANQHCRHDREDLSNGSNQVVRLALDVFSQQSTVDCGRARCP